MDEVMLMGVRLMKYHTYTIKLSTGDEVTGEFDRYDAQTQTLHLKPKYGGTGPHRSIREEHIIMITRNVT